MIGASEHNRVDGLLISRPWPVVEGNQKNDVLLRRRRKALKNPDKWRQQVKLLTSLIEARCRRPARVLDVACGTGFRLLELANLEFNTTGVEIDPNLCELTNAAAAHFDLNARSICGDACAIPLADSSFDVVMSKSFFEHVYDRDLALGQQIRVLKPGGLLIIQDGNMLNPKTLLDLLFRYPIRSRGQYGGLKWLFSKGKVHRNLYGYLPQGRDEDVKTVMWWRKRLSGFRNLRIIEVVGSGKYTHPGLPSVFHPFVGSCLALAERVH